MVPVQGRAPGVRPDDSRSASRSSRADAGLGREPPRERLALIDSQLDIARGSIGSVDGRVDAIAKRMATFKPYAKSPTARRLPDPLAEEAVRILQERRSLNGTMAAREKEMVELREQFDADLARYRELTANRLSR